MNTIQAIILGTVQGLTEFLPVSSTGHMILTSYLMGIVENPFTKSFQIIIQLASIMAVVFLYYKTLIKNRDIIHKIFIAFLPTAILGFIFYPLIKKYLFSSPVVVVSSLFIGGVLIVLFERFKYKANGISKGISNDTSNSEAKKIDFENEKPEVVDQSLSDISYKKAFFIGLWQSLAMVPGVSRSAATIIGGEVMGIKRTSIVEFSFLVAIPTMIGATALDLYKSDFNFSSEEVYLLSVGCVISFIVAVLAIKTFIKYIKKHSFSIFGYYRIVLAVFYALLFL
jgi:undecaprenyl-diphosphatase